MTHRVESDCSVSKAPGAIVLIWLSYNERSRTLRRPVKLSLWMQLIRLFLSILAEGEGGKAFFTNCLLKPKAVSATMWLILTGN